jgi:hypothetical protein
VLCRERACKKATKEKGDGGDKEHTHSFLSFSFALLFLFLFGGFVSIEIHKQYREYTQDRVWCLIPLRVNPSNYSAERNAGKENNFISLESSVKK